MKSRNVAFIIFLTLLSFISPGVSLADKPTYAKARPIDIPVIGGSADHTYVCTKSSSEKCYANMGGNSGGKELSGSRGSSDTDYVKCVNDLGKREGDLCYQKYAKEAVCHQESNIGLVRTNKTVRNAKKYSVSSKLFGIYGTNLNVIICVKECLTK